MVKRRSVQQIYRSISKPRISPGGFSSYSSTLVSKQQAAENAIIDNQYAAGDISADYYLSKLNDRLAVPNLSPLQQVTLRQKIADVGVKVQDAQVASDYASGAKTTSNVLAYEQKKLNNMSAADSTAYLTQQKKVQDLTDKAQKEARSAYRVNEANRIAQLPDDNSATLWEKSKVYGKLANQARLDGDTQTAISLETQQKNAENSAKQADSQDRLNAIRGQNAATPTQGLGVPSQMGVSTTTSAGGGNTSTNTSPGGTGTTPIAGAPVNPGQESATSNPFANIGGGISSSDQTTLNRYGLTLDRLYGDKADNQNSIAGWQKEIDNTQDGDYKQKLQTQLDQLINRDKEINNSIDNTNANIDITIQNIQERSKKHAVSFVGKIEGQQIRIITDLDKQLENQLLNGTIKKQDYLEGKAHINAMKEELGNQVDQAYTSVGEPDLGTHYQIGIQKEIDSSPYKKLTEQLIGQDPANQAGIVENFGKNYDLLRNENTLDVSLIPVKTLKLDKTFSSKYLRDSTGVLTKVYNGATLDATGLPDTKFLKQDSLLSGKTVPYYIDSNGNSKNAVAVLSKDDKGNITKIEYHTKEFIDQVKGKDGKSIFQPVKKFGTGDGAVSVTQKAGGGRGALFEFKPGTSGNAEKLPTNWGKTIIDTANTIGKSGIVSGTPGINPFDMVNTIKNFFSGNKNQNKQTVNPNGFDMSKILNASKNFQVIPTAKASNSKGTGNIAGIIDKTAAKYSKNPEFAKVLHAIALTESGGNPNAIGDNGQSIGLFQNRKIYGRGANFTDQQLKDPVFNTDISAKDLVRYFDQGVKNGLSGADLVAYVSRNGQRPAAGLEWNAAKNYGLRVGQNTTPIKSGFQIPKVGDLVPKAYGAELKFTGKPTLEKNTVQKNTVQKIVQGTQPGVKINMFDTPQPTSSASLRSQQNNQVSSNQNNNVPSSNVAGSTSKQNTSSNQTFNQSSNQGSNQRFIYKPSTQIKNLMPNFNPPPISVSSAQFKPQQPAKTGFQNIVNTVKNVAGNVRNFLNQFNPFRKR